MMKNPIGWVEIPVTDIDRAEAWYQNYFGFEFDRQPESNSYTMSWFPMDMQSYGTAATLIHGPGYNPSTDGALVYFASPGDSVTTGLKKAAENNITVLVPNTSIGENGYFAIIQDSEGNRIAIHSMNE